MYLSKWAIPPCTSFMCTFHLNFGTMYKLFTEEILTSWGKNDHKKAARLFLALWSWENQAWLYEPGSTQSSKNAAGWPVQKPQHFLLVGALITIIQHLISILPIILSYTIILIFVFLFKLYFLIEENYRSYFKMFSNDIGNKMQRN